MIKIDKDIFLPGSVFQFQALTDKIEIKDKSVLVMGAGSEEISKSFSENGAASVIQIVEDQENLLSSRFYLKDNKEISIRMMEFDNTDFIGEKFDIIYAQASISNSNRNKIVKEIKKILKTGGIFCVGENTQLEKDAPPFVKELWESSDIEPLFTDDVNKFYNERNFEIIYEEDFSSTLKDFYKTSLLLVKKNIEKLSEHEKSYHKKFLNKMSHESNAYLNLGADKFMGFKVLIMKKV